jgi:hypothetical protein
MTTMNVETVTALLTRAVAQRGEDYVYPASVGGASTSCHYRWDQWDIDHEYVTADKKGAPACIAGQIMDYIGILDDIVGTYPDGTFSHANGEDINSLAFNYDLDITPLALAVLYEAQATQDAGLTWGVALRRALDIAARNPDDLSDEVPANG